MQVKTLSLITETCRRAGIFIPVFLLVYFLPAGASSRPHTNPVRFSVVNTTSNGKLRTQVQFNSLAATNINGELNWKILDSLNQIVATLTRTVTIAPSSLGYTPDQTFTSSLPSGIYRIVCIFQSRTHTEKLVSETYYATIHGINLPQKAPVLPRISFLISDVFKNTGTQNQNLQGFIKDHLNTYLHARFITARGRIIIGPADSSYAGGIISVAPGRYLADAALVWKFTRDRQLKKQIDSIAYILTHTQESDGFLGIRFSTAFWSMEDIISLQHNIRGLLVYYQSTGYKPALNSAIRAANLVVETFNSPAGNRAMFSIGKLTASSLTDPMLDMYIQTGDNRYLQFCLLTFREMEAPGEPRMISGLSGSGNFDLTGIKMEDLLTNLTALLKLYRVSGNNTWLVPCKAAWQGIINEPGLLTLSSDRLENLDILNLWTAFNAQFALSTGEVSYFNQVDKAVYRSQSSAILPYSPIGIMDNHPVVVNYETGSFKEEIVTYDGLNMSLNVNQYSDYPNLGRVALVINPAKEASFTLSLRRPARTLYYKATIAGKVYTVLPDHFLDIQRFWKKGDQIDIQFELLPPYLTASQETDAYQQEAADQLIIDRSQKRRHQIRRSW